VQNNFLSCVKSYFANTQVWNYCGRDKVHKPNTLPLELYSIPIQELQQANLIRDCLRAGLEQNVDFGAWKKQLAISNQDWANFLDVFAEAFTIHGAKHALEKMKKSGEQFTISGSSWKYIILDVVDKEAYKANGNDLFLTMVKIYNLNTLGLKLDDAKKLWKNRRDYRYEKGKYQNPAVHF